MRLRHALGVAFAIAATLTPAALAAGTAAPPQVSGISKIDDHTVRVIVRAPGDLTATDVQAEVGGKAARVTRLRPLGRRRPLHLVFAVDTSTSMVGQPLAAAVAAGQRLLDAVGSRDEVGQADGPPAGEGGQEEEGRQEEPDAVVRGRRAHPEDG